MFVLTKTTLILIYSINSILYQNQYLPYLNIGIFTSYLFIFFFLKQYFVKCNLLKFIIKEFLYFTINCTFSKIIKKIME